MMEHRYSGGQLMPNHVVKMLCSLGKIGVISSGDWSHYFCHNKNKRWQERQLAFLRNNGYIKKHNTSSLLGRWILDEKGMEFLHRRNWPVVGPVPAHHVDHDEFIAKSLYTMERESYINSWKVERELKMMNQKDYLLSGSNGETKYPDAVFKIKLPDGLRTIALEYERHGKSESRYRSILWNYSNLSSIALVIFICEKSSFIKRIEKAFKNIGKNNLNDRLATTSAINWQISPLEAKIKTARGEISLKKISLKFDS